MARPLYETPKDRAAKLYIASKVVGFWEVEPIEAPKLFPFDCVMRRGSKRVGYLLVKRRKCSSSRYPTYMISAKKVEAARKIERQKGVPVILVVEWKDTTRWCNLTDVTGYKRGGRYDRGDAQDVEDMAHFHIRSKFKPMEEIPV